MKYILILAFILTGCYSVPTEVERKEEKYPFEIGCIVGPGIHESLTKIPGYEPDPGCKL